MSNKPNPRRGEKRRTETGPRWESANPGKGSNSTHVARARRRRKRERARRERRAPVAELAPAERKLLEDAGVVLFEDGTFEAPLLGPAGDAVLNALLRVGMKKGDDT